MIGFPTSPVLGQTHTYGARTWEWNGSAWRRQINAGQKVAVLVQIGPTVEITVARLPNSTQRPLVQFTYV